MTDRADWSPRCRHGVQWMATHAVWFFGDSVNRVLAGAKQHLNHYNTTVFLILINVPHP
jgi:hypothetical protein